MGNNIATHHTLVDINFGWVGILAFGIKSFHKGTTDSVCVSLGFFWYFVARIGACMCLGEEMCSAKQLQVSSFQPAA